MADVAWIAAIVVPIAVFLLGSIAVVAIYCSKSRRRASDRASVTTKEAEVIGHNANIGKKRARPFNTSGNTVVKAVPYKEFDADVEAQNFHKKSHSKNSSKDIRKHAGVTTYQHHHGYSKSHSRSRSKGVNATNTRDASSKPPGEMKMSSSISGQDLKWYNPLRIFKSKDDDESLRYEGTDNVSTGSADSRRLHDNYLKKQQKMHIGATNTPNGSGGMESHPEKVQTRTPNHFTIPITQALAADQDNSKGAGSIKIAEPPLAASGNNSGHELSEEYLPRLSVNINRNTSSSLLQQMNLAFDNGSIPSIDSTQHFTTKQQLQKYPQSALNSQTSLGTSNKGYNSAYNKRYNRQSTVNRTNTLSMNSTHSKALIISNFGLDDSPNIHGESAVAIGSRTSRASRSGAQVSPKISIQRRRSSLSHKSLKSIKSNSSCGISNIYQFYGEDLISASKLQLALDKPLPEEPDTTAKPSNPRDNDNLKDAITPKDTSTHSRNTSANSDIVHHVLGEVPITPPNRSPLRSLNTSTEADPKNSIIRPSSSQRIDNRSGSSDRNAAPIQLAPFESPLDSDDSPSQASLFTAKTSRSDTEVIRNGQGVIISPQSVVSDQTEVSYPEGIVTVLGEVYRVVHPYTPELEDELELRLGEKLIIFQVFDDGWCFAKLLVIDPEKFPSSRIMEGICPKACLASL